MKNKLRFPVSHLSYGPNKGKWVVNTNSKKTHHFTTLHDNEEDAVYAALVEEGHRLIEKLDAVQKKLEATGRIHSLDPHGWRA